jgi:transmembrane sensor
MTEGLSESDAAVAARRVVPSWEADRLEHNLSRVHARRSRRRTRALLGGAAVVLSAAALLLLFVFDRKPPPLSPISGPVAAASAVKSPKTTFADGSVARVSDDGELRVVVATPEHIESVLTAGAADFEVTKHAGREFVVLAGSVRVEVVGTRFRVERDGERTRVSVAEGKVEVHEGDLHTYLEAGESRFFPSLVPAVAEQAPRVVNGSGAHARFLELARGGEFKAAYQVMSQSPTAVGSSAEDLFLAADAARLSNHPEQAVGFLRRVATEHAADSRAPLSAFTLGRVLLSQLARPAEAAEAFALARRLRPSGSLAEDALAREAEARAAAGSAEQARKLAQQYVTRYPKGKHLPTMQRLATSP